MSTQSDIEWRAAHPREYWIGRIDQVRAVIMLTVHALLSGCGPDDADTACALDLANQELQRLRDEIDASRLEPAP